MIHRLTRRRIPVQGAAHRERWSANTVRVHDRAAREVPAAGVGHRIVEDVLAKHRYVTGQMLADPVGDRSDRHGGSKASVLRDEPRTHIPAIISAHDADSRRIAKSSLRQMIEP